MSYQEALDKAKVLLENFFEKSEELALSLLAKELVATYEAGKKSVGVASPTSRVTSN